jgi:hypothetical protein
MSESSNRITDKMRSQLQPKGTADIVQLGLTDRFFQSDFINKCIDELERMPMRAALGEEPTSLEKLAYILLCDSAYINIDKPA